MKNYECIADDNGLEITFASRYENIEKATDDTILLLAKQHFEINQFDLKVVLQEVLGNAIRHGNGDDVNKRVFYKILVLNNQIEFEIKDEGEGFDPAECSESKENALTPHGMGLFIIKSLGFEIDYCNHKKILKLRKTINNN